uniref:Serpin-13 n=1 Tax=Manduca sexta TaxID=7130 RepID=A0A3G1VCH2_MANSE|nr:serpin-13 [Manduca sexta]
MKLLILAKCYFIIFSLRHAEAIDDENKISSSPSGIEDEQYLPIAVNEFGYKFTVKMMEQNTDDNVVISPTSIAGLLAMTLLGSVGNTYQELATTLGFSQDILTNRRNHEQFGNLLQNLNSHVETSKTLYADAIFVDAQTQLRDVFRDYLDRVYRGEALSVDFRQKEEVKQMINEWVKSHTQGKIENFLKQTLPETSKAVLLSALYFSGQWEHPFIADYTMKMPFKKRNNTMLVDLMLNLGDFNYISSEKEGVHMIALPYNDSETTLYALKPRIPKKQHLLEVLQRLDYKKINDLIKQMMPKKAVIRFPKMDLQHSLKLEETLKDMGIKSMFSPIDANFALMVNSNTINKTEDELISKKNSDQINETGFVEMLNNLPNPGVYVDSIIHDVKLTINEYGTEAVAATSGILARSAEQFYADSPFYMFIRNEKTKLVTFSAAIFDPTK